MVFSSSENRPECVNSSEWAAPIPGDASASQSSRDNHNFLGAHEMARAPEPGEERLLVSRRGCESVLPPPRGCECGGAAERGAPRVGKRALLILLG